MIAVVAGAFLGFLTAAAQRLIDPFGWLKQDPWTPTITDRLLTILGWALVVVAALMALWMLLGAWTSDNVLGGGGATQRLLDTLDRQFAAIQTVILTLIPSFGPN